MKKELKKTIMLGIIAILLISCQKASQLPSNKQNKASLPGGTNVTSSFVNYDPLIDKQISFILSCQLSSGAIMTNPATGGGSKISGYFANVACLGVLEHATAANISAVKKWMIWYMNHLNGTTNPVKGGSEVGGSVYDYMGAAETNLGTYDSIDSYAATFLTLAKRLIEVSPDDKAWLAGYSYQLTLIGNALTKCIDNSSNVIPTAFGPANYDGLTIDSYVHGAKYTMDNSEVNQGLKSMVWLESNVITGGNSAYYQSVLTAQTNGMEADLWRGTMYNWYYDGTTGATNAHWGTWYPDATCQLYPATLDVISPTSSRATALWAAFNTNYPSWSTGHVYDPGGFPWAIVSYAAAKMNDTSRATAYLNYLQGNSGFPTNWYNFEAGVSILAAKLVEGAGTGVNLALNKTATASSSSSTANASNDGNMATRWSSNVADNEWWEVDLGSSINISKVNIFWEAAYDTAYSVQTSTDNTSFTTVFSTTSGTGGTSQLTFAARNARYVKILCTTRVQPVWGSSMWEVQVFN
jgi:hypothetical protein